MLSELPAQVSIHAPVMGANQCCNVGSGQACFNPRTRDGCEWLRVMRTLMSMCFNPRTRDGCEKELSGILNGTISFNPRTRDGCERLSLR